MFKRGAGLAVTVALAFAAVRFSAPAIQANPAVVQGSTPSQKVPNAKAAAYAGGCSAYEPEPDKHGYPFDENQGAATAVIDGLLRSKTSGAPAPATLKFAIALAPDPVHTNLSLMFDRQIVMIEQAAQDEGYTFNSSWLPWRVGDGRSKPLLADAQRQDELAEERQACPGVMLFRKSIGAPASEAVATSQQPFAGGLIVFVVGEQPTGGINHDQWQNAVAWLASHATPEPAPENILRVLGPTFSGSIDSLERNLAAEYAGAVSTPLRAKFPKAQVLSGTISSCSQILTLEAHLRQWHNPASFGSFQENDELQLYRFLSYMKSQGTEPSNTAILSEDETAYAQLAVTDAGARPPPAPDPCNFNYPWDNRPVHMVYPRDISALRDAYEKQSVFGSQGSPGNEHAVHAILRDETDEKAEAGSASDTVTQFSGHMAALSEEAYLFGVVSYLRTHHTQFLVLRCTNPLDFLFLTRFFHRAYAEARVVTVGSDLLFRREIDTTEFRGVLSLSTYPLLPRDQHWSSIDSDRWGRKLHNHLIFENGLMEGLYIASRYLLNNKPVAGSGELALERRFTPDYADPYWLHAASDAGSQLPRIPPTWLSTVGRDGYWPLAVLNDTTTQAFAIENKFDEKQAPPPSTMVELIAAPDQHYLLQPDPKDETKPLNPRVFSSKLLIGLPTPWNVFAVFAVILICYQIFGLTKGSQFLSDGVLLVFRRINQWQQALLLGGSCALALMTLCEVFGVVLLTPNLDLIDQRQFQNNWGIDAIILIFLFTCIVASLSNIQAANTSTFWQFCRTLVLFLVALGAMAGLYIFAFDKTMQEPASAIPTLYRTVHLSDGASPLLSVLMLTFGFYLWNWQAMAGNLLLAEGRPTLPRLAGHDQAFYRVTREFADRLVHLASPLSIPFRVLAGPIILLIIFFGSRLTSQPPYIDAPLLSMEGSRFNLVFNSLLLFGLLVTCAEALRLYWTWIDLRRVLLALGRMRLRRTFAHLRAIDATSLWTVSGNVQRTQYRIFVQQLNTAMRVLALARRATPVFSEVVAYGKAYREYTNPKFAQGARWDEPIAAPDFVAPRLIRDVFTDATDFALTQILMPEWESETRSLHLHPHPRHPAPTGAGETEAKSEAKKGPNDLPLADSEIVQALEEFVCLHYLAFIQNIVARMRTMTLSMVTLFVSVCFAISFYPFVPRTSIALWMALNLALIAAAVIYVYAGMEKDEILSYITDSRPGELGSIFWLKVGTFLAGPAIGLLTTQFPTIADSVLSWLQPGLDALK